MLFNANIKEVISRCSHSAFEFNSLYAILIDSPFARDNKSSFAGSLIKLYKKHKINRQSSCTRAPRISNFTYTRRYTSFILCVLFLLYFLHYIIYLHRCAIEMRISPASVQCAWSKIIFFSNGLHRGVEDASIVRARSEIFISSAAYTRTRVVRVCGPDTAHKNIRTYNGYE